MKGARTEHWTTALHIKDSGDINSRYRIRIIRVKKGKLEKNENSTNIQTKKLT